MRAANQFLGQVRCTHKTEGFPLLRCRLNRPTQHRRCISLLGFQIARSHVVVRWADEPRPHRYRPESASRPRLAEGFAALNPACPMLGFRLAPALKPAFL